MERHPLEGELLRDETDYSGRRFFEREFILKGPDRAVLEAAAERRRRNSFIKYCFELKDWNLRAQLAPDSRKFAEEVLEDYYVQQLDPKIEAKAIADAAAQAKTAEEARLAKIPTVWQAFEADLERRVRMGVVQENSADTCRYEANAFKLEVPYRDELVPLRDVKINQVTETVLRRWYDALSSTETRFGKLRSGKTLEHALNHLNSVRKALRRDPEHRSFASTFDVVEELLEEARQVSRDTDGWRRRMRMTNEQVIKVIGACTSELERAVIALALAGARPPSELVAVEWDHLEYDTRGHLWWHVCASAIERRGEVNLRESTKTRDVDHRQLSICERHVPWVEARRGKSRFVLGVEPQQPMSPTDLVNLIESVLERAEVKRPGISTYSLRHTVGDEVERILGRTARDLVLHGKRDKTTGGLHYSHAERDRRRAELEVNGLPYGDHMVWAR